jgi:hypothetical protein
MPQDVGGNLQIKALFYLGKVNISAFSPIFRSKAWQEKKRRPEQHLG